MKKRSKEYFLHNKIRRANERIINEFCKRFTEWKKENDVMANVKAELRPVGELKKMEGMAYLNGKYVGECVTNDDGKIVIKSGN